MSAPRAAELAEITYRQLDHWARQQWVQATHVEVIGERRVRRYSVDDVVRLAALRHLALSKLDIATLGPQVGATEIPIGTLLVTGDDGIEVIPTSRLRSSVTRYGRWTIFDPEPVRQRCSQDATASETSSAESASRRSA